MTTTKLPRIFKFKSGDDTLELPDPNPNLTPKEVMSLFANQYAELTNANISGPKIEDDKAIYEFSATIGTKG